MRSIIWSLASRGDLKSIDTFLEERDGNVAVAILSAISVAVMRLIDYPRIGRPLEGGLRVLGVRSTPYVIVYRVAGENTDEVVSIVRIRHRRENWVADMGPAGE